jgi:hypothetical protein
MAGTEGATGSRGTVETMSSAAVMRLSAVSSTGAAAVVTVVVTVETAVEEPVATVLAVPATASTVDDRGSVTNGPVTAARLGCAGSAGTAGSSLPDRATPDTADANGADIADLVTAGAASGPAVPLSADAALADAKPHTIQERARRTGSRSARRRPALSRRNLLPIRITPQRNGRPEYARYAVASRGKIFARERRVQTK